MDWAFRMSIEEHSVPREDWVGMLEDAGKFLAGSLSVNKLKKTPPKIKDS